MGAMRNNIILGIILSVGVTVMVMLPRLATGRDAEYLDTMAINTLVMLLVTWFGHLWLLSNKRYRRFIATMWMRNILSIVVVSVIVYYLLELVSPAIDTTDKGVFFGRGGISPAGGGFRPHRRD